MTIWFWGARRSAWKLYGLWWKSRVFIGISAIDKGEEWKDSARCPECKRDVQFGKNIKNETTI